MDKASLLMPYKVKENGDILYSMYEGLHSHGKIHLSCYDFAAIHLIELSGGTFVILKEGIQLPHRQNIMAGKLRSAHLV